MICARRQVLNLGAAVGALCVLAALAAIVLDVRPMVFRSGSMAPTIDTGALALVHRVDATVLAEGDVVTVPTGAGTLVTHRIVQLTRVGDGAGLRLRGDANEATDQQTYHVIEADRVVAAVPMLGYAVGWLTGPLGRFVLGLYAAFLVMVLLKPAGGATERIRAQEPVPGRRRIPKPRAQARAVTIAAMVVLLGAAGITRATPGWAVWTDVVEVSGTSLSAATVPPPASFTCGSIGVLRQTFSWSTVPNASDYTLYFSSGTESVTTTATTATIDVASGTHTAWVVANRKFGANTWSSVPSASRTYSYLIVGSCF